jgi:hypothetical protein
VADARLEDRRACLDAAKHRLEPIDLVVDGPSLVPPGGAGLDQRTEQITGGAVAGLTPPRTTSNERAGSLSR